jgi:regulator of sirC expression with transglutaminase-like and TPR domain
MMEEAQVREAFALEASLPESVLNLARAALLIAAEEYLGLNISYYIHYLDDLAELVRPQLRDGRAAENLDVLSRVLFEQEKFSGDIPSYYDPRNSFLNDVIERRVGIPITLSIIYLEVGWRLDLPLAGVSLPGHFLVRCDDVSGAYFVDPFSNGLLLDEMECAMRMSDIYRDTIPFRREFLKPVSKRAILIRVLRNLKSIYYQTGDYQKALACTERILIVEPLLASEVRDRGLIRHHMGHLSRATDDLFLYLLMFPHAEDAEDIRRQIDLILSDIAGLN